MAKHTLFRQERPIKPSKLPIHPIWRGIGCMMVVLIPAISYGIATILLNNKENLPWLIIPQELIRADLKDHLLLVRVLYAALLTFIIGAILLLITVALNKIFGVSRFGPYDVPPEEVKIERRF